MNGFNLARQPESHPSSNRVSVLLFILLATSSGLLLSQWQQESARLARLRERYHQQLQQRALMSERPLAIKQPPLSLGLTILVRQLPVSLYLTSIRFQRSHWRIKGVALQWQPLQQYIAALQQQRLFRQTALRQLQQHPNGIHFVIVAGRH